MTNKILISLTIIALGGCTTATKCGSTKNSETIFSDTKTCEVRIRQVLVASKMNLPSSVKSSDLPNWDLDWSSSDLVNGQIQLGHFVLRPPQVTEKSP